MMKTTLLSAAIALAAISVPAGASAQSIFGNWLTDDGSAIVKTFQCGQKLCGKIKTVRDPKAPDNDINNPDPQRRSKPLVGTTVLHSFSGAGTRWKNGRAYDPKAGRTYRSKLKLIGSDRLKVTGCVLFICRSRYWTRAN